MLVALVNMVMWAAPPTGFTTAVERLAIVRTGPAVTVTVDPFSKSVAIVGATLPSKAGESHLCPERARTRDGVRLTCVTRRLWASVEVEDGEPYLELRSLRGVTWRWEPNGLPLAAWPLSLLGIPESCPGVSDAARAECALGEGNYFEAEELFSAALNGPDAHLARLRLGDFALLRGDPEVALGWYTKVSAAGPVTRIAQLRACDLSGTCLGGKPPTTNGLMGAAALEAEIHLIRMALAVDQTTEAMRRLHDALEAGLPICTSSLGFCQKVVQTAFHSADDSAQELALAVFTSAQLAQGPLGAETTSAAADAAETMGAPIFAANLLASISGQVAKPELSAHLMRVASLYLAGRNPVRAQFVVEYAEQRLDAAAFNGREWRKLRRRLAPAPVARTPERSRPALSDRLPAMTDEVNVSAELARAAKASSAAVTSGERP